MSSGMIENDQLHQIPVICLKILVNVDLFLFANFNIEVEEIS